MVEMDSVFIGSDGHIHTCIGSNHTYVMDLHRECEPGHILHEGGQGEGRRSDLHQSLVLDLSPVIIGM